MNKQQLAAKIWESVNKMRSKIEANEYKDYILGLIFYRYLSDKQLETLKPFQGVKILQEMDVTADKISHIEKQIQAKKGLVETEGLHHEGKELDLLEEQLMHWQKILHATKPINIDSLSVIV